MSLDRERWLQLAKANAEVIRHDVDALSQKLDAPEGVSFAEFWAQARDVSSKFRSFKPMEVQEREGLWAEFRAICERARTLQHGERERTLEASRQKRERIEAAIAAAAATLEGADTLSKLAATQRLLNEALGLMKNPQPGPVAEGDAQTVDGPPPSPEAEVRLIKEDREACWSRWVALRESVKSRRSELRKVAQEGIRARAEAILAQAESGEPHGVQDEIRALQVEIKGAPISQSEQERIREALRTAWKKCSERIESARSERKQQHAEWIARMTEHVGRWEVSALKSRALVDRVRAELADLESRAAQAHSADEAGKRTAWAGEKRERLEKLEESLKELEAKVVSVRARMGKEAPPPVTEIPEPPPRPEGERPSRERSARARSERPRGDRRGPRPVERETQPTPPPGLNLGEVLAEKLGLAIGTTKSR